MSAALDRKNISSTNFMDTFIQPINFIDILIHASGLLLCSTNMIFCIIGIYLTVNSERQRYHLNFCILRFHVIIAYLCISITHGIVCVLVFVEGKAIPEKNFLFWHNLMNVNQFGTDLLRCLWISMCFERTFATILSKIYETSSFIILSISLSIISYTVALLLTFCHSLWQVDLYFTGGADFLLDITGLLSTCILSKFNRKLRKINSRSNIQLSQRYQLAENIRALKLILPILKVGIILTTSGTILFLLSFKATFFYEPLRYTASLWHLLFDISIFIAMILWVKNDAVYKIWILRKFNINQATVGPLAPTIYNFEGEFLPQNDSPEYHYQYLKQMWS